MENNPILKSIIENKNLLIELLRIFPSILMITDREGKVLWVNDSFVELTGYTLNEIRGLRPREFLHGPETNQETVAYMSQKRKEGVSFHARVLNYRKDKTSYWIEMHCVPVYHNNVIDYWLGSKSCIDYQVNLEHQIAALENLIKNGSTAKWDLPQPVELMSSE